MENKKNLAAVILENFSVWQIGLYALVLLLCFITFQHGDLYHTIASSYAYLTGHFWDFYDYNKPIVVRNDYLPIVFLIFAALNFPLKLMGLTHPVLHSADIPLATPIQIIVCKLFLAVIFFATVWVIYKTARLLSGAQVERARVIAAILATAPIAVFAIFVFGQYDIFGVFFTAVGFYYYLKRDFIKFAIFFSIAISFKFFALIVFAPLLLLSQKNFLSLAKFGLIAISFSLFQIALYWHSAIFQHEVFDIASTKLGKVQSAGWSFANTGLYLAVLYGVLCLYAFLKKPANEADRQKIAVLICIPAYAAVFTAIVWHPQWIIIPMPFFALSALYIRNKNILYLVDTIGMLAFTWCVVDNYKGIESSMYTVSLARVVSGVSEQAFISNADFMSSTLLPFFKTLFSIYLFSPLLIIAYEKCRGQKDNIIVQEPRRNYYFMARFLLGMSFFLVPTLLCAFLPYNIAEKINPDAFVKNLLLGANITSTQMEPVGEILPGATVVQSFRADRNKLRMVAIMLATYDRHNKSDVKISLLNDQDKEIASRVINAKKLEDNSYYNFSFPAIPDSIGKTYKIEIAALKGHPGDAITAWMSKTNQYPDGVLTVNNVQEPGDLIFGLYYEVCPDGEATCPEALIDHP